MIVVEIHFFLNGLIFCLIFLVIVIVKRWVYVHILILHPDVGTTTSQMKL